jgi:hypothetical protein
VLIIIHFITQKHKLATLKKHYTKTRNKKYIFSNCSRRHFKKLFQHKTYIYTHTCKNAHKHTHMYPHRCHYIRIPQATIRFAEYQQSVIWCYLKCVCFFGFITLLTSYNFSHISLHQPLGSHNGHFQDMQRDILWKVITPTILCKIRVHGTWKSSRVITEAQVHRYATEVLITEKAGVFAAKESSSEMNTILDYERTLWAE